MLKLHFAPNSRAGRILWLLEEAGLPYELNAMPFSMDALKSPEHRGRHPLGRVPVLDDDDVRIFESGAIVEYILERHAPGRLKPAVDSAGSKWCEKGRGALRHQRAVTRRASVARPRSSARPCTTAMPRRRS